MCVKCKGIACEECVKKMLSIKKICRNCKQVVRMEDMIKLPFMNDLTSFFIYNVQKNQNSIKQSHKNNEINYNKKPKIIKKDICKYHREKIVEYTCLNCCENLCSECLLFFNKKNVVKHIDHIILSNEEINEFGLEKIIKEYKVLTNLKMNIKKNKDNFCLALKEIEIRKKEENYVLDLIKSQTVVNYNKKIKEIKNALSSLKKKN